MAVTSWGLLLLILFFSFLTFYSAYFEKVTDCGCFGDAIKLTPWQSFFKDIILLLLLVPVFVKRKKFNEIFSHKIGILIMLGTTATCLFIAYWVINHLSFIDFRPYHVGANIPENMKLKPNAKPDIYEIRYTIKNIHTNKEKIITDKEYMNSRIWEDTTWKIIKTSQPKLIQKGDKPKITDYRIFNEEGEDLTEESFKGIKLLILMEYVDKASIKGVKKIKKLIQETTNKNITTWVITGSDYKTYEPYRHEWQWAIPFYNADSKVIKTIIRSNPGIVLLKNGIVLAKWHYNDTPDIEEIQRKLSK